MCWLRIALLLIAVASLIATMTGETTGSKVLAGCFGSAALGLLWAVLLHYTPQFESASWSRVSDNAEKSQYVLIRFIWGDFWNRPWPPMANKDAVGIIGSLISPIAIVLFITFSVMLGLDQNLRGYVLDLQHPVPPEPKALVLYMGSLFCLSTAFMGLFLRIIERLLPHKQNATVQNAP